MPTDPLNAFVTTIQSVTLNGTPWEGVQTITPATETVRSSRSDTYSYQWEGDLPHYVGFEQPFIFEWPASVGCCESSCAKPESAQDDKELPEIDNDKLMAAILSE